MCHNGIDEISELCPVKARWMPWVHGWSPLEWWCWWKKSASCSKFGPHKPGDVVFILFLLAAFHYCKGGFVIEYYVICAPTAQLVGEPGPTRLQRVQVNSQQPCHNLWGWYYILHFFPNSNSLFYHHVVAVGVFFGLIFLRWQLATSRLTCWSDVVVFLVPLGSWDRFQKGCRRQRCIYIYILHTYTVGWISRVCEITTNLERDLRHHLRCHHIISILDSIWYHSSHFWDFVSKTPFSSTGGKKHLQLPGTA